MNGKTVSSVTLVLLVTSMLVLAVEIQPGSASGTICINADGSNVTITAYCFTEGTDISVSIAMDGFSTGFNTPHTFVALTGSHTFTVPSADANSDPFLQWSTCPCQRFPTITVTGEGTYTAYYQAPPPTYNVTINAHCNTESVDVSVPITMDGSSSGHSTAYTFTGLTGTHIFTLLSADNAGHQFLQWSTGQTSTTIAIARWGHLYGVLSGYFSPNV